MKSYFILIITLYHSLSLSVFKTLNILYEYFLGKISNTSFNFLLNSLMLKILNFLKFFLLSYILISVFFKNIDINYGNYFFITASIFISIFFIFIDFYQNKLKEKNFLRNEVNLNNNLEIDKISIDKNNKLSTNDVKYYINKKNDEFGVYIQFTNENLFLLNVYIFQNLKFNELIKINKEKKILFINLKKFKEKNLLFNNKDHYQDLFKLIFSCKITNFKPIFLDIDNNQMFLGVVKFKLHKNMNYDYFLNKKKDQIQLEKNYKINLINRDILQKLEKCKKIMKNRYLTTAYFFNGVGLGNPFNSRHGYGKWKLILQDKIEKFIKKKSVIDFGSNCCILPIYLSQEGKAKSVDCVELFADNCEVGKNFKSVMEYQISKKLNLNIINNDMFKFIKENHFKYDVATFFCSLYYLEPDQIKEVIDILSRRVKILIIQANEQTSVLERKEKSDIYYLQKLVKKSNFKIIEVYDQKHLVRPFFIARSTIND